jgi:hypothetical protein
VVRFARAPTTFRSLPINRQPPRHPNKPATEPIAVAWAYKRAKRLGWVLRHRVIVVRCQDAAEGKVVQENR